MRRAAIIVAVLVAAATGLAASASGDDSRTYFIELDNAFGLVDGSEVKVAGVAAGSVSDFYINSDKRAVAEVELSGPMAVLGEKTVCSSEPQSLIAEYFIDCTPRGDPIEPVDAPVDERIEDPDIPVEQTRQTVQNDLVLNTMRLPFTHRLRLLINEFGTGLAGNAENLNEAIRRGAPALRQTRQVTKLLADQNTIIRDLNVDSDRIIGKLAERRQDVVDFIETAGDTAQVASSRRDELSRNFALLDDFLAELGPTMTELNALAVQGTPLATDLRRAAPDLLTLSRRLPGFNRAATQGLGALGEAGVVGRRALHKGRDEINALGDAARNSFPVSDDLSKFLRDIDDPDRAVEEDRRANRDSGRKGRTGYTGMEGLLNYLFYQTGAINQFDRVGHMLHFSIFEVGTGPCAEYNAGPTVPSASGGQTTNILDAHRCVAWLGPNQPGINQGPSIPPYDGSVCPDGSTDPSICDPASRSAATATGSKRDGASAVGGAGSRPGAGGGSTGSGGGGVPSDPDAPAGPGGLPDPSIPPVGGGGGSGGGSSGLPGLPGLPDLPGLPRRDAAGGSHQSRDAASAGAGRRDLIDFLFGL